MSRGNAAKRVCAVCRSTVLSRYNAGSLCGTCERGARETAGIVPTHVWDSELLRDALARMDLPAVVAILRSAVGLSQLELGNLLGWSQAMVALTEAGARESIYDIRVLFRLIDALDMPKKALEPLFTGRVTLGGDNDVSDLTGEIDVERRDFNTMAAGLLASALVQHVTVPDRVDPAHIRYLRATIDRIAARDQSMGGGAVLTQALRQFSRARRMLDESDYTEAVGRQLLIATGDLGIICGWVAYDHGDQQLARRLYSEAQLLANSSGDTELQTHVLLNMAMQSTHLASLATDSAGARGFAREGLRLAEQASDIARHEASPRLHALVALRQAASYAQLGDGPAFRTAITLARRELDRGPHPTDPVWAAFVTPSEITHALSWGYLRLGDARRAVRLLQDAPQDSGRSPRNRVCDEGSLAGALLEAGDRTEAISTGRRILPVLAAGEMTSARPLGRLRPVRVAAEEAGDEEFCAHYDAAARALAS